MLLGAPEVDCQSPSNPHSAALAAAQVPRDGRSCFRPFSVSRCATGPSSSGGHCGLTNLRLRSRAQLGARGRSSALAGWPAFDGPSSAAGLSDRRICAGGLAGFLTGWAGRTFRGSPAAQRSADQPMWRKLIARYLLLARAILPLLRHTRGAARGRRKSPRGLLGLGSAAFSPFYCDKNPDGERPAFWKTGFCLL